MFSRLLLLFLPLCLLSSQAMASTPSKGPAFSFHLLGEPYTLDPLKAQGSAGSYLYSNLFRGLFKYDSQEGLVLEGAKSCKDVKNTLVCRLDKSLWSNGEPITAQHYVQAFRRLSDPNNKSPQLEALLSLKNAKKILSSQLKPESLGVKAKDSETLIFEFEVDDPEFRYKLTLPAMAPIYTTKLPSREQADTLITNGPYKIRSWTKGRKILLENNPYYTKGKQNDLRPPVEIYFIEDDSTALNLYLTRKLTFLRRLETDKIGEYQKRADFYQVPMARFDYIGFGKKLKAQKQLRQSLATSLNYEELQKLYKALGRPGCPSLPARFQGQIHCHIFNPTQSQNQNQNKTQNPYDLAFSKMGGEDIQKGMEWAQHQWKKNLKLRINLKPQEQGYYIKQLQQDRFDMFRKGVGLDRPTCLAALEIFLPDHPENYIRLNDPEYINKVEALKRAKSPESSKKLCSAAIKVLIDKAYIIPLGEMHFTVLARPEFKGWSLNEMNQLDLTNLRYEKP